MKKIVLIFIAFSSFAQNNIKAIYNVKISEDKALKSSPVIDNSFIKKINENAEQQEPFLLFNNELSVFKLDDNAILENKLVAITILTTTTPLYIDLANKTKFNVSDDKQFIIMDSLLMDWNLVNETKKIGEYVCYKAIQTHHYTNGRYDKQGNLKYFEKSVIAWYCPELNYSYGPRGFGGLPGLIIELQYDNILYGLKKIEFNSKEKLPLFSKKAKIISRSDFEKMDLDIKKSNIKG
ncbi:GLPGLI family protein [Flavobacterium sp. TP390]|uniref:GLPGLI family protein n=1 Tax=Flavobacterium profundi TaxID=1774945 RepID=A0A6I4IKY7_9FLAO|nr:GLPGLI family protein [Flavobacterium profundi]MVO08782.1 GLPGLI family protein [Flavobacterium profundi]